MINALIELSAKNRFVVFLIVGVAVVAGVWSMKTVPIDAIPDLSDTQVIVYSRWDRSPDIVEDQVTYPIVTAMLGAPKVKAVRGFSDFGFSYVYIVFEEGTDIYWARSRTMEYLSGVLPRLPQGVRTESVGYFSTRSSIRAAGTVSTSCAATRIGTCSTTSSPCPASPRWRRWAASCASIRSRSTRTACGRSTFPSAR